MPLGFLERSMEELEIAHQLDPLSLIIQTCIGDVLVMLRQYDRAIDQYRKVLDFDPGFLRAHLSAGRAHLVAGHYSQAISHFETAACLWPNGPTPIALLANAHALSGSPTKANELIRTLKEISERVYVSPYLLARTYFGTDNDRAYAYLEEACEERDPRLVQLNVAPVFDCIRNDPRFRRLQERLGLLERAGAAGRR